MNNLRYSIGFSIEYNNQKYKIATLSLTEKNKELFYQFSYIRKKKATIIIPKKNIQEEQGMPDHISFHKDGTIHITHKKYHNSKYRYKEKALPDNLFNIAKYGFYPLLMESFYFNNDFNEILPKYSKHNPKEENVNYLLNKVQNFSLVLVFCKSIDASMGMTYFNTELKRDILIPPCEKQMQIWFKKLNLNNFKNQSQKKNLVFEAFNGWWIIPIFTKYVFKEPPISNRPNKTALEKMVWELFPDKNVFLKNDFDKIYEKN